MPQLPKLMCFAVSGQCTDVHPFDNDMAADFANDLDDAVMPEREALIFLSCPRP
ncbi:DUF4259 domain-containing protein [Streptomyces sp. NPDC006385]|uniref:DUF4259 domain-containing protein n=1 Tax=Streptomyces sp. NPDC006385 TaxID=3156761 RepID=UPI0033A4578A